jgi:hypothetical protein
MLRPLVPMLFALASACGLVSKASAGPSDGADNDSSGDVLVNSSPVPFDAAGITSCSACLAAACTDVLVQCEEATACDSRLECALGHSPCSCVGSGDGAGPFLATERCFEEEACHGVGCAAACSPPADGGPDCLQLTGTTSCERHSTSSTRACDACVAEACGGFASACGADCQAYVLCAMSCQSPSCQASCRAAHAAGATDADALDVCLGSSCGAECDF